MTANNRKAYLGNLKKLVDEYNKYLSSFYWEKPIDTANSAQTEKVKSGHKGPTPKAGQWVRMGKYKNTLSKVYKKNWLR